MIGRTLGGATVATLQGIIVFFIAIAAGFRPTNITLLPVAFLIMVMTALFFTAMGTALASLLEDMQGFQMIMNFLVMPIFFLSGALFPLEGLPDSIFIAASLNPLTYGVDGLRGALAGQMHFSFITDFAVLSLVTALFLVVGSYLFSKIEI
ncbi:ABC-2 type transporter [uncultured archaeon]|nr:ABC-2 type transporter [uncultured archaeon]